MPENSKITYKGKRWEIVEWKQKLFSAKEKIFETVRRKNTVVILPILPNGNIVIEKELQPHWNKPGLNLVSGGLEDGEDALEGARRETEEETGLVFKDYYLILKHEPAGGILWKSYVFVAKNLIKQVSQKLDDGEQIETKEITKEELIKLTRTLSFKYKPLVVEHYIVQDKIEEFFDTLENPEKYQIEL